MLISKVRKYIADSITSVDSDFRQHRDAFNDENIASTNINKSFHIAYSIPSIASDQATFNNSVTAEIKFFFKGQRDTIETFDNAMDTVSQISMKLASLTNIAAFRSTDMLPIQTCVPVSQVPEQLNNNDNSLIITLSLEMNIVQSSC